MIKEFRDFIAKGNVMDMAVGIIIGAAFTPIVTMLNEKVIMPFIGGIFGKPNFDYIWTITMGDAAIQPGFVVTAIINFLLIALALYFLIVRPMNKIREKAAAKEAANAEPVIDDVTLLTEIRDLLASKN